VNRSKHQSLIIANRKSSPREAKSKLNLAIILGRLIFCHSDSQKSRWLRRFRKFILLSAIT